MDKTVRSVGIVSVSAAVRSGQRTLLDSGKQTFVHHFEKILSLVFCCSFTGPGGNISLEASLAEL